MIYLSLALNVALLALLVAQRVVAGRELRAERAHYNKREDAFYAQQRGLIDTITLLKVSPQTAVAQAASVELEDLYIPPLDDEALAEYEAER